MLHLKSLQWFAIFLVHNVRKCISQWRRLQKTVIFIALLVVSLLTSLTITKYYRVCIIATVVNHM